MSDCCPNNNKNRQCKAADKKSPQGDTPVNTSACCPPPAGEGTDRCPTNRPTQCAAKSPQLSLDRAGYSIYPFVSGWLETSIGNIPQVKSKLGLNDHSDRWAVRWGIGRFKFQITPGFYAVGHPDADSPLLISANYKFSFDCLRSALAGEHAWILVIDTKGVNVWCAAGKGTFGTEEIVRRINGSDAKNLVRTRQIIVPQLAAPGVAAYKVKQETGFDVVYGPIRAADLKLFLAAGMQATTEMRQVTFSLWDRLVLTPVEIVSQWKPILYFILLLFILSGVGADIFSFTAAWQRGIAAVFAGLVGLFSGSVLTPIFLPWLPPRAFAAKGALFGLIPASVLALGPYQTATTGGMISLYLLIISVSSYAAMNFTGASTYTSPSGVEKELRIAIPCQTVAIIIAGLLWIVTAF